MTDPHDPPADERDDAFLYDAFDRSLDSRFRGEDLDPDTLFPDCHDRRDELVSVV